MSNLSVNLLNKTLKNPVIAASGTFGFGVEFQRFFDPSLLGGISLKALTPEKKSGNPPIRMAETASGVLNSVGLQNPGVKRFKTVILPLIRKYDTLLIANIAGKSEEEYLQVIEELNDTEIDMFELNISCPNVSHGGLAMGTSPSLAGGITAKAKKAAKKPLIVKLSPNVGSISDIAAAVEDSGADAVSLVNTFLGMHIDIAKRRPTLKNNTGGLSGPAIKPLALRMVNEVFRTVKIPIIGMGGIMTGEDLIEFMLCGAACCMVGTANLSDPYACPKIIAQAEEYLIKNKIENIGDLVGKLELY